jgi:syntaxin-binding protein 5
LPDYSSILCFVGTSRGHFATFKILPSSNGAYAVNPAGSCALDDRVLCICPMNAETGEPATATQSAVSNLKTGYRVDGVVIVVTPSDCRIFKPASAKGAHKSWDEFLCDSATIVKTEGSGYSLVGLFGDGTTRAFSIPALKEIGSATISQTLDVRRLHDATISPTGDILGWIGPSEMALLNVWGTGLKL